MNSPDGAGMMDVHKTRSEKSGISVARLRVEWATQPHTRRDILARLHKGEKHRDVAELLNLDSKSLQKVAYMWRRDMSPEDALIDMLEERERYELENTSSPASQHFKDTVAASRPRLVHFALSLTRNESDAEDLASDAIATAYRNHHQFEEGTNLNEWLMKIIKNKYLDLVRRSKKNRERASEVLQRLYAGDKNPDSPESHANHRQMLETLKTLPSDQRQAFVLVALEGHSIEEAAVIQGVAEGTIKSRVNRARTSLRKTLEERGFEA